MIKNRVFYFSGQKSRLVIVSLLMVLLCLSLIITTINSNESYPVTSYSVANKIIVIDPGHGGTDTGAVRGDIIEKEITLSISQKLGKKLSQSGAAVILTRDTDKDMIKNGEKFNKRKDLTLRVEQANEHNADLYISIHTNAVPSSRWQGAQTFYSAKSEKSKVLAESIQRELTRILGNTTRSALAGDYFVINNTEMPAVIVEVGFISNQHEGELLKSDKYQEQVAEAILSGISEFHLYEAEGKNSELKN